MRILHLSLTLLALLVTLAPASHAGSERLIMNMTAQRMAQEHLIHARFVSRDGTALESNALQQIAIREKDCESGRAFEMTRDYKIGYEPEKKQVGLYLLPHAWKDKTLCFSIPGLGRIEKQFTDTDSGRSIPLLVGY
ncbi:MAG: hypothetical protein AB1513_00555 [Pseudomonadota bacterium]